jgi:hypothetical protein
VERKEGGLIAAVEILVNSPKISKHIAAGEIKEIQEEVENSVSYYHMQSMNQSLIALLAHDVITYEEAMQASAEPEDLSLKLRKLFPRIEEQFREGVMAPSPADFSQITELLEIKKLYEEAEERHRSKLAEKEEQVAALDAEITDLRRRLDDSFGGTDDMRRQVEVAQAEAQRVRDESNQKIAALNERIRELNARIAGQGGKTPSSGFFKR